MDYKKMYEEWLSNPYFEVVKPILVSGNQEATNIVDGTYTATAAIRNNSFTNGMSAQLIVAVYDGDALENCYFSEKEDVAVDGWYKKMTVNDIVLVNSVNKNYSVKLMMWDSLDGNLVPLCEAISYPVQN